MFVVKKISDNEWQVLEVTKRSGKVDDMKSFGVFENPITAYSKKAEYTKARRRHKAAS